MDLRETLSAAFPESADRVVPSSDLGALPWINPRGLLYMNEPASPRLRGPVGEGSLGAVSEGLIDIARSTQLGPSLAEQPDFDAYAAYLPFSVVGGVRWGVYWNEPAVLRATAEVAIALAPEHPDLPLAQVARLVDTALGRHEGFHATVEHFAAHLTLLFSDDYYRSTLEFGPRVEAEEASGTAIEIDGLRRMRASAKLSRAHISSFRAFWEALPLPPPYSKWTDVDRDAPGSEVVRSLGAPEASGALFPMVQDWTLGRGAVQVPQFSWGARQGLGAGEAIARWFLRMSPLPMRQVEKHLKKIERSGRPGGVRLERATKHWKVQRPGKSMVTLDLVKWDSLPLQVVGQLAELLDMSRAEYWNEVRAA